LPDDEYSEVELRTTTWAISRLLGDVAPSGSINAHATSDANVLRAAGNVVPCRLLDRNPNFLEARDDQCPDGRQTDFEFETASHKPRAIDNLPIVYLCYKIMAKKPDLLPGTLDMLILKTLTRSPLHGYGIALSIKRLSDEVLTVEEGSLYPALQRLLLQGWVKAEWKTTETSRRARFYTLTPTGRKQLSIEMSQFQQMIAAIGRVMTDAQEA
jgi:PadR family transcriptional regulator, regulatory protein PadR